MNDHQCLSVIVLNSEGLFYDVCLKFPRQVQGPPSKTSTSQLCTSPSAVWPAWDLEMCPQTPTLRRSSPSASCSLDVSTDVMVKVTVPWLQTRAEETVKQVSLLSFVSIPTCWLSLTRFVSARQHFCYDRATCFNMCLYLITRFSWILVKGVTVNTLFTQSIIKQFPLKKPLVNMFYFP